MAKSVLIVEDEFITALFLTRFFDKKGYKVFGVADTSVRAVEMALSYRPDIIIMDIKLKDDSNGIEAAQKILEKISTEIVFLTALSDLKTKSDAEKTSIKMFINKPIIEQDLEALLEKLKNSPPAPSL